MKIYSNKKRPVKANITDIKAAADISNLKIFADYCEIEIDEDSYEEGEGDYVRTYSSTLSGKYENIQQLIDTIVDMFDIFTRDVNDYVFLDGSLQTDATVNGEDRNPTPDEIEAWKNGQLQLYVAHLYVPLEVGVESHVMTEDEAKAFGIPLY